MRTKFVYNTDKNMKGNEKMITDNIKNAALYYGLNENFKAAFEFLAKLDKNVKVGRYEINENLFINVQEYEGKAREEARFESHGVYCDIQYMICGRELIDSADASLLKIVENKLDTDDFALYNETSEYSTALINDGDFCILFPSEGHRPGIAGKEGITHKAVAKIKIN